MNTPDVEMAEEVLRLVDMHREDPFRSIEWLGRQIVATLRHEAAAPVEGEPSCADSHHKYVGRCPYCHATLPGIPTTNPTSIEAAALVTIQMDRLKAVEKALANGAYYADDEECHPLYPIAVGARQTLAEIIADLTARLEAAERERDEARRQCGVHIKDSTGRAIELLQTEDKLQRAREGLEKIASSRGTFNANQVGVIETMREWANETLAALGRRSE